MKGKTMKSPLPMFTKIRIGGAILTMACLVERLLRNSSCWEATYYLALFTTVIVTEAVVDTVVALKKQRSSVSE